MSERSQKQIYDEEMQMGLWEAVRLLASNTFRTLLTVIVGLVAVLISFVALLIALIALLK